MINDNKEDFLNAVKMSAEKFRSRSFECCMNSFLKTIIKKSIDLDVPVSITEEDKVKLANEVKATIDNATGEIIGSVVRNETDEGFNVDIARAIVNPKDFVETVSKSVSEHVFAESNDRASILKAQYDSGVLNGKSAEEMLDIVNASFENLNFLSEFNNGKSLALKMKSFYGLEGSELIDSIKSDVLTLIDETETKNSVIREAIADINDKKEKIEESINGDKEEDKPEEKKEGEETSSESFARRIKEAYRPVQKRDLYNILDISGKDTRSAESFTTEIDSTVFSREAAEDILNQFRALDDGIDMNDVPANSNTFSISDEDEVEESKDDTEEESQDTHSNENEYINDNDERIEVDMDKFEYEEVEADQLSEESFARDLIPLSLNKMMNITPEVNTGKMAAFLALQKDHGTEFFDNIRNRGVMFTDLMSKEDCNIGSSMAKDEVNEKLNNTLGICQDIELKVHTITEDLGILGILDGKYQRSDSPVDNAVKSLVEPSIIQHVNSTDPKSKESLEENEYATIFKLALKLSDIQSDIAKGVNLYQNTQDLGTIEAILNEKIYEIPVEERRFDVESKVKALQSLESIVPFEDIINIQAFVSKSNDVEQPKRIVLDSIKDIDAYGYSSFDEIEAVKADITKKFEDKLGKGNVVNFNIDELVNYIVEERDTTKIGANLYEKIISKLIEDKTIETSVEGMIIRNKAKTITTCFVAADKLNLLAKEDREQLDLDLI